MRFSIPVDFEIRARDSEEAEEIASQLLQALVHGAVREVLGDAGIVIKDVWVDRPRKLG